MNPCRVSWSGLAGKFMAVALATSSWVLSSLPPRRAKPEAFEGARNREAHGLPFHCSQNDFEAEVEGGDPVAWGAITHADQFEPVMARSVPGAPHQVLVLPVHAHSLYSVLFNLLNAAMYPPVAEMVKWSVEDQLALVRSHAKAVSEVHPVSLSSFVEGGHGGSGGEVLETMLGLVEQLGGGDKQANQAMIDMWRLLNLLRCGELWQEFEAGLAAELAGEGGRQVAARALLHSLVHFVALSCELPHMHLFGPESSAGMSVDSDGRVQIGVINRGEPHGHLKCVRTDLGRAYAKLGLTGTRFVFEFSRIPRTAAIPITVEMDDIFRDMPELAGVRFFIDGHTYDVYFPCRWDSAWGRFVSSRPSLAATERRKDFRNESLVKNCDRGRVCEHREGYTFAWNDVRQAEPYDDSRERRYQFNLDEGNGGRFFLCLPGILNAFAGRALHAVWHPVNCGDIAGTKTNPERTGGNEVSHSDVTSEQQWWGGIGAYPSFEYFYDARRPFYPRRNTYFLNFYPSIDRDECTQYGAGYVQSDLFELSSNGRPISCRLTKHPYWRCGLATFCEETPRFIVFSRDGLNEVLQNVRNEKPFCWRRVAPSCPCSDMADELNKCGRSRFAVEPGASQIDQGLSEDWVELSVDDFEAEQISGDKPGWVRGMFAQAAPLVSPFAWGVPATGVRRGDQFVVEFDWQPSGISLRVQAPYEELVGGKRLRVEVRYDRERRVLRGRADPRTRLEVWAVARGGESAAMAAAFEPLVLSSPSPLADFQRSGSGEGDGWVQDLQPAGSTLLRLSQLRRGSEGRVWLGLRVAVAGDDVAREEWSLEVKPGSPAVVTLWSHDPNLQLGASQLIFFSTQKMAEPGSGGGAHANGSEQLPTTESDNGGNGEEDGDAVARGSAAAGLRVEIRPGGRAPWPIFSPLQKKVLGIVLASTLVSVWVWMIWNRSESKTACRY